MIIGVRTWWAMEDGEPILHQVPVTAEEYYVTIDSLQVTEDASAAVAVAPRVSKEFIENQIAVELYCDGGAFVAAAEGPDNLQPAYKHHTFCVLTTRAGFSVVGHSAPASPDNFNAELGKRFAYENAFRQLWPLFAFALLEHKYDGSELHEV